MRIQAEKCTGCGFCHPYCPTQAIYDENDVSTINADLCFECGTCLRVEVCPVDAIYEDEDVLKYPRVVRKFFSDPTKKHKGMDITGRGTDEVKTNDVTKRYKNGEVGIGLEVGRPTVGARLRDLEKLTMGLAQAGFNAFEKDNPVSGLMTDRTTGKLKDEILDERILSAILEFKISEDDLESCLEVIYELSTQIDTVFTMDLITCYESGMKICVQDIIDNSNFIPLQSAKINIGIGRCSNQEEGQGR